MGNVLEITLDGKGLSNEFKDLVERYHKENPKPDDIKELGLALKNDPDLYRSVLDISKGVQTMLVNQVLNRNTQKAGNMGIRAHVRSIKIDMMYDHVPVLERLLIDNIVNSWLHYLYIEMKFIAFKDTGGTFDEGKYWDRILSSAQRRYLRACETLARVRKITGSTYQVNIAAEGGQQINVAGDLVKD